VRTEREGQEARKLASGRGDGDEKRSGRERGNGDGWGRSARRGRKRRRKCA
jgi:hypothetical protein